MIPGASPEEMEAVRLRWERDHPGTGPPPEEWLRLLREVRARKAAIERESWSMLMRRVRQTPTRSGFNSDSMRLLFFYVLIPAAAIALTYLAVASIVQGFN
ncbi:MAG TPA: hypothetical protein VGE01_02865 [Fimbriimonas sp.]